MTTPSLSGLRILVVDDDETFLEALAQLLEINGAEVRRCRTASGAREAMRTFRADLVISDLSMPEEGGFDLIMAIRQLPADEGGAVPAIAFSALTDSFSRTRALQLGFQEYVAKSVDPSLLVGTVRALTGRTGT